MIANAIKAGIRQDDKQNYRGIEKPKIDSFDGNVSKYRQWKSAFDIMYTQRPFGNSSNRFTERRGQNVSAL